ncbi:MAG: hypothetical protein AABX04_07540 [Nanoarchaeota archaeon]|mgnify:FL=1
MKTENLTLGCVKTIFASGQAPAVDFIKETREQIKETKEKVKEIQWTQLVMLFLTLLMAVKMYFPNFLS